MPDPAATRPAARRRRLPAALALALLAAPADAIEPAAPSDAEAAAAPEAASKESVEGKDGRQGTEILVDGIAAQVGSEIVLISEVRQISGPIEARMRAGGAPDQEVAKLRADVLEGLVDRALVRQVVRRTEIGASEAEVDAAISAIAKENGLSVQQLQASVESQGLGFEAYRGKIRGEIEHTKVMNGMVASQVRIEDEEVKAAYREQFGDQPQGGEEVHLRHLLVPFTSAKPEEQRAACREAHQARTRIEGGAPFAEVAAQVSPINPRQGGDIGWIHVTSLASWMAPAVDSLGVGQTSDVIEMPFGCNLLQLVERRSYEPISFEQAQDLLRKQLFDEKMREQYIAFIEKLRTQTYVERKGYFADAARLGDELPPPDPAAAGLGDQ